MNESTTRDRDPLGWCIVIALAFMALCFHRIGIPSRPYFDEVHYVQAARKLLEMIPFNREHPMVGKEILAGTIALLGDRPWTWRLSPVLFGSAGLFAFGRLVWLTSADRRATLLAMVLLATNFTWFMQTRIAMLDVFMASLTMLALWQFAAALNGPARAARWRLALVGVLLGLAIGAKWNAVLIVMLPGLLFALLKFGIPRGAPAIARISLPEAAVWLGVVPLAVYWASYMPEFFYEGRRWVDPLDPVAHHELMIRMQDSVRKHHTYQSVWTDWIINRRPIWFLYEAIDGAQRGILLLGNPLTMLAGLPALAWCAFTGTVRRKPAALVMAILYLASLALWMDSGKPVQFYYHYMLPGAFLMGCLGLALADLSRTGRRGFWLAMAVPVAGAALFVWFYPIISAAVLAGKASFKHWMWLRSWA